MQLANVMDLLLDAICIVDTQGRFVSVSAACERIFGYTPAEMIGRPMIEFVFPEDRAKTLQAVDEIVAGEPKPHFENRYVRKDGGIVDIMWSARWSEADQMRVAVARDITERKRAEATQAALFAISEAAYGAADLVVLFRRIHRIIGALLPAHNFFVALYDAVEDQLSFPYYVDEVTPAPPACKLELRPLCGEVIRSQQPLLLTHDGRANLPEHIQRAIGRDSLDWLGVPLSGQQRIIGALVVQSYSGGVRYTEKDAELLQFVSRQIAVAIERKQLETQLQHLALHDELTALPNRALFYDRLQTAVAWARRDKARLSLLYIDLDMFKQVNDSFGHAIGDLLLQEVASRLSQCVRESDTVGRIGGDEFLVLLHSVNLPSHALQVAEKIRDALSQLFALAGVQLQISPSIGIAHYPEHGGDYQQLIRCADQAMYAAKRAGGNRFSVVDHQTGDEA